MKRRNFRNTNFTAAYSLGCLYLSGAVAAAVVLAASTSALAERLVDSFDGQVGSGPNSYNWISTPGVRRDGAGSIVFDDTASSQSLRAIADLAQGVGQAPFKATLDIDVGFVGAANVILGVSDNATHYVVLRNDLGGGVWKVYVQNGPAVRSRVLTSQSLLGRVSVRLTQSAIEVLQNGAPIFNTATMTPDEGGAWSVPSVALVPTIITYTGAGTVLKLNNVVWDTEALSDDFSYAASCVLDPSRWDVPTGMTVSPNNGVDFDTSSGPRTLWGASGTALSLSGQPEVRGGARLSVVLSQLAPTNVYLGLGNGSDYVLVRNDLGNGKVSVSIGTSTFTSQSTEISGAWTLEWLPSRWACPDFVDSWIKRIVFSQNVAARTRQASCS